MVLNSCSIETTNTSSGNGNPCTGDPGAALHATGPPSHLFMPARTGCCPEQAGKSIEHCLHPDTALCSRMLNTGMKGKKKQPMPGKVTGVVCALKTGDSWKPLSTPARLAEHQHVLGCCLFHSLLSIAEVPLLLSKSKRNSAR